MPSEPRKRRSGAVYFAAAVVFAILIAVALPGQVRNFTIRSVNQLAGIFAGSTGDTASLKDDGSFVANVTPSVPGQEVLTADPTRIGDVVPGPVAPVVLVPDYRLDLASVSGANSAASTLTPAPSGIANDANLQATAGVAGIGSNSLQVASLAASVSDPLPALPDAPPAAPAKRETPTIVPVKRPNLATDAATPVAVAPVAMIAVTAMPRNSDVSTASSALQSLAFADSAASTVLLAAILADPLGVDAPLKMPGPTAPISIASNYSATPAFADVIESINLDARLPGTFRDLAPSFDFVSLPQSAAPGDAPAALVSPEPSASALANAPIARPAEVADPVATARCRGGFGRPSRNRGF